VRAVHGVDLTVGRGEIVGLLGRNGGGQDHSRQDAVRAPGADRGRPGSVR
jgi:ABC-type branched-subunit amino acid transport system ATPase component